MQHAHGMLLFLVLAVNSTQFRILRSYALAARSYALLQTTTISQGNVAAQQMRTSTIFVFHWVREQLLGHCDGLAGEVRIILHALPQLNTSWRVPVARQQWEDIVLQGIEREEGWGLSCDCPCGWTSTGVVLWCGALPLALSCYREAITIVLDCVPASWLIGMWLCMYYCAWECPASYAVLIKLYENLTCIPLAAHSYHVKLQHQE